MQALKSISRLSFIAAGTTGRSSCRKVYNSLFQDVIRRTTIASEMSSSSTPIYTVDYLTDKLKKDLDAEHLDIEDLSNCGCGMKFDAVIVSPKFEGKLLLQRQRLVNQTLSEEMKHIHAFTMKTLTPQEWEKISGKKEQGGEV